MSLVTTGMQTVTSTFQNLPEGLYDYVLPFLILFAIVYGLLDELDLFDNDAVTGVISIAFAFFVTTSTVFGEWMAGFVPSYGLWLIFAIAIMMALQMGMDQSLMDSDWAKYLGAALALGTAYLIYVQEGWQQVFGTIQLPIIGDVDTFTLAVLIGAGLAVAWIISES